MELNKNSKFFEKYFEDLLPEEEPEPIEFSLGYIPFTIERISDGEKLRLNDDKKTYSFIGHVSSEISKYTWARLFMDSRCTNEFKALGWVKIENIDKTLENLEI